MGLMAHERVRTPLSSRLGRGDLGVTSRLSLGRGGLSPCQQIARSSIGPETLETHRCFAWWRAGTRRLKESGMIASKAPMGSGDRWSKRSSSLFRVVEISNRALPGSDVRSAGPNSWSRPAASAVDSAARAPLLSESPRALGRSFQMPQNVGGLDDFGRRCFGEFSRSIHWPVGSVEAR